MRAGIIISLSSVFFLIVLFFFWIMLFAPEQYYVFDPYIDTRMAPGYTPEKFDSVQTGMDQAEVIELVGHPLYVNTDTFENEIQITFDYTQDGKLMNTSIPWYRAGDYAWYGSRVIFNTQKEVIDIHKGWYYD